MMFTAIAEPEMGFDTSGIPFDQTPPSAPVAVAEPTNDDLAGMAQFTKEIRRNVLLTHVSIHQWRGQRRMDDAETIVDGAKVDKKRTTEGKWQLMPEAWRKKFSTVEGKLRGVISRVSPRFPIPGVYVIPRLQAKKLFEEIDRITKEEFDPLVDELVAGWDAIVAEHKKSLTEAQFKQIEKHLPTAATKLKAKFQVVKHVIPMGGGDELVGADAESYAKEIEQYTRSFVEETARSITDGLSEELGNSIDTLVARIDDQGVVKEGTLNAVQAAFEKMKGFSFAASPDVLKKIQAVEKTISETDCQRINRDNRHGDRRMALGLAQVLKDLQASSEADLASVGRFGRARRAIDL